MNQMNNRNQQNFGLPQQRHPQNFGQGMIICLFDDFYWKSIHSIHNTVNPNHQDRLNGGYYGGNDNYANQTPAPETENEIDDGSSHGDEDSENHVDPGQQDYGGGGGGDDNGAGAGDDSQQNPADDPDIQQLQNFGGPLNDNFPEGLFPPGLLSKEDIAEIRRQQEKQQREEMERERRRQRQQNHQSTSPDYDNSGSGENENGDGSEHQDAEYPEGAGDGEQQQQHNDHDGENSSSNENHHDDDQSHNNNDVNGGHIIDTTPLPPAYKNAYQPIQPQYRNHPHRNHMQPINEYHSVPGQHNHHSKNQFNQQQPPNGNLI